MTFLERLRGYVDQGLLASKNFVSKAGAKAHELGEKGVLKLEITQLESQAQKVAARLGIEVYEALVVREADRVSPDDPVIKGFLAEITAIKSAIEKKEEELKETRM